MAKFCDQCGAPVNGDSKFCPGCGKALAPSVPPVQQAPPIVPPRQNTTQQQYYQPPQQYQPPQYTPPPIPPVGSPPPAGSYPPYPPTPAPKPKLNIKNLIIAGAGVIIIALVVVLIVVLAGKPGGNAGNNGGNVGASSGSKGNSNAGGDVKVEVPKNASNEEKLAYNYIEFTMEFWQKGMEYDEAGLSYVADSFFAMAAANTCSMRYAIDCILELKGSPPANDERLRDWEAIAALGWASPFPYFFEGVVLEAKGDGGGANECYRKAALNPNFLEGMENFKTIKDLDEKALKSLKATLEELEDKIFETTVYEQFIFIPRDENNFSVDYLREKAMACLEAETEDLVGAYDYYLAAVLANPFDGDSYAQLAVVCLYLDKGDLFAGCINAGLAVNPKNERLGFLQDLMRR